MGFPKGLAEPRFGPAQAGALPLLSPAQAAVTPAVK